LPEGDEKRLQYGAAVLRAKLGMTIATVRLVLGIRGKGQNRECNRCGVRSPWVGWKDAGSVRGGPGRSGVEGRGGVCQGVEM